MFEGQVDWDVSAFGSKEVLDMMPGGLCIYHVDDDQFIYVSPNMLNMLGYTEAEFRTKFNNRFSELVYIEDREATITTIVDQVSEKPYDSCIYRIEKSDGTLMWVKDEGHLTMDSEGRECFFVVLVDITELHRQNLKYSAKNQREYDNAMQELLVANPNAICAYKLNLTQNTCSDCHGASDFVTKLIDAKTVDELLQRVGLTMVDDYSTKWFVANISREKLLEKYIRGERRLTVSYRRLRENGKPLWVKSFCHMLENPATHDIEVIVYTINVEHSYKEEKILSRICEKFYDCFGLIDVASGKLKYYYGTSNLENIDLNKIKEELGKKEVYYYFTDSNDVKKQLNFFYFDDQEEYIIFSQIDMERAEHAEKKHQRSPKYRSIENVFSRQDGESQLTELLKKYPKGCFFIFDIDDFKITNDTFGHRVADRILHNFAIYLELFFSGDDLIYRLAGDKFAAFSPELDTIEKAGERLERIYDSIYDVKVEGQDDLAISISTGAHIRENEDESYEEMCEKAAKQLRIVKANGKCSFLIE
ncbi:diguanylate cyclase domain-containing protein [Lachnospiraceae bacterium C1.1]|nr:sensor domain-containing diguanylate cyclase [Lachnospiraceae bacterium C1.1]